MHLHAVTLLNTEVENMKNFAFTAIFTILASHVSAQEFVVGLGTTEISNDDNSAASLQIEYHTAPIKETSVVELSWALVGQVNTDGDVYLGAGIHSKWPIRNAWFAEASFAAGYYDEGTPGSDLGGNIQFRTLLGLGYELSDTRSISLAIDHLSNASLEDFNPGRETLSLRYSFSF